MVLRLCLKMGTLVSQRCTSGSLDLEQYFIPFPHNNSHGVRLAIKRPIKRPNGNKSSWLIEILLEC